MQLDLEQTQISQFGKQILDKRWKQSSLMISKISTTKNYSLAARLFSDIIAERHSSGAEVIQLPTTLSSLHFALKDINGRSIDTQGHPVLLTLVTQEP